MQTITFWKRRAKAITFFDPLDREKLTEEERSSAIDDLREIATLAELAARIIESGSASIKDTWGDDDDEDFWCDLYVFPEGFWTKSGKKRVRLTHAGMALVHDLHQTYKKGYPFPALRDLGFVRHRSSR